MSKVHYRCIQGVSNKAGKWERSDVWISAAKSAFHALIREEGSDLILGWAIFYPCSDLWVPAGIVLWPETEVMNADQLLPSCELSILILKLLICNFLIEYKFRSFGRWMKKGIKIICRERVSFVFNPFQSKRRKGNSVQAYMKGEWEFPELIHRMKQTQL